MSEQKAVTTQGPPKVVKQADRVQTLLAQDVIRKKFEDVLKNRAPAFISSIITAVSGNEQLRSCEPMSVISSAMMAAQLDLPITPSLGLAHIVPYKGVAQFQIGWKGFVQLAQRTGLYKGMNATLVYEGQLVKRNTFTGEMEFQEKATSQNVVGYLFYFKNINGFEKYTYMTTEEVTAHAKKYSASYKRNYGAWAENFDAMALKTVVKQGLSKWGVLSVGTEKTQLGTAIEVDQALLDQDGNVVAYPDREEAPQVAPSPAEPKQTRLKQVVAAASPPKRDEPPPPEREPGIDDPYDQGAI